MNELIQYARSSAEWLEGMEHHIKHGSPEWVVNRAKQAANELKACADELEARANAVAESLEPFKTGE